MFTTKTKITFAEILYFFITLFLSKKIKHIQRDGIFYEIDLSEAIDFSLFLFGNFQKQVVNSKLFSYPKDSIIFDVGANFGAMSLQFAKNLPYGHLYSFEPTHYAFERFMKNLKLNPIIASRITPVNCFISDKTQKNLKIKAFSSWKIDRTINRKKLHPIHLGKTKSAYGIISTSLDDFCKNNKITRIDFIKIDTDGHEYEVLKGSNKIIIKYRPFIIFEVGDYLMNEKNINFVAFLNYFSRLKYDLFDNRSNIKISLQNYRSLIPLYSTIDIAAIPKEKIKK